MTTDSTRPTDEDGAGSGDPRDAASTGVDAGPAAAKLAAEIRRRRTAVGLSQPDLAKHIGYSRDYISCAERLRKGIPSADLVQAIDVALNANGALTELRCQAVAARQQLRHTYTKNRPTGTAGLKSTLDAVQQRLASIEQQLANVTDGKQLAAGPPLARRAFIGTVTSVGLPATLPQVINLAVSGRRVGQAVASQLRRRTARLRRLDNYFGGADTLHLYETEFDTTTELVRDTTASERTRQELLTVAAEQAQMAGWAAFDAGQGAKAERLFKASMAAASDAADPALQGNALAFLAYQQVNNGASGVALAIASCDAGCESTTPAVKALLWERRAWTHALAGQASETEYALAQARQALDERVSRPEPDWVYWVDQTELQIMTGRCWTELRRPLRAVPILESVLETFSDSHARDKALYLTWLADAYIDANEIEQGVDVVHRVLDLSTDVASVRPAARVNEILRHLQPYHTIPAVTELMDRVDAITHPERAR